MPWVEVLVAFGLIAVLAVVLLPSLARSRESAHRSSCMNNLKQLGLVMKMYANENRGYFPPLSPIANNWMMDAYAVYPEYLTDPNVLVCPTSPLAGGSPFTLKHNAEHPGAHVGDFHPDCVSSLFYIYTGYLIVCDEQAAAVFDAYYTMPAAALNRDLDVEVPVWADSDRITGNPGQNGIPVMWDRVPLNEVEFSHVPSGCNVLHMDGHVEFVRYSYYNNSNFFPATRLSAETFGAVLPYLPSDCYETW